MSPRPIRPALAVPALYLTLAALGHAQTYAGDYDLDAEGVGVVAQSAVFSNGPAWELLSISGEGTTLTGAGCLPGVASSSFATIERQAYPGRLRTECVVHGEQYTASPCGYTAGGKTHLNQSVDGTDLIFRKLSNPAATGNISVSLNVEFRGLAGAPFACGSGNSQYTICAGAGGSPCKVLSKLTWNGGSSFGPLVGYANDGSLLNLTSGTIGVALLQPQALHLGLDVLAGAVLCESANPATTHLVTWAELALPTGGPVFNLPPDVTVDSVQLGIVDNQWVPCSCPLAYCTAGTSGSGCQASLSATGSASATAPSGFSLLAGGVEGAKDGLFFFGTGGRQANSWGNGTSFQCVVPPVTRAGLLGGGGTAGLCDGAFAQDLNALWCPACPKASKNPGAGALVQAQLWYRDPLSTSNQTTSLSDALEFLVLP